MFNPSHVKLLFAITFNTKLSSVAYHPSPIDFQEANTKAAT